MTDNKVAVSIDMIETRAYERIAELEKNLEQAQLKVAMVVSLVEQMTVQAEEVANSQRAAASGLTEIQAAAAQSKSLATEALAAKTQIDDHQTVVAQKSGHIELAQAHADKVRSNLDRQLTAAMQQVTEAEALNTRTEAAADSAAEQLLAVKTAKATAESERDEAMNASAEAQEAMNSMRTLVVKAESVEKRVLDYEAQLERFRVETVERIATIDGLLPGATSAGLSSAFDLRRQAFLKPGERWQWVFVAAITFLVILALTGLWNVYRSSAALSYDELFRVWLARLPVAGALIWLALYASRESALAKRLEEDYGYKSAIAASFQGFHKQMSDIAEQAGSNTPLAKLCIDTLTTIASPPGRIYDKHNLTVTPSAEATELLKSVLDRATGTQDQKK
ncbi:hypothetical protein M0765_022195 [Variovorax sp. S2]|uniref:hypothetical protein n=1 Tax=Variovorax sp. S12S4 TaxID=3029170 RepID=UPI00215C5D0C|nr:hypothetical protein [Variovorax sp. S12S4]MCR8960339.1 hypothetical protein [Variovorax sp. S12S4]